MYCSKYKKLDSKSYMPLESVHVTFWKWQTNNHKGVCLGWGGAGHKRGSTEEFLDLIEPF